MIPILISRMGRKSRQIALYFTGAFMTKRSTILTALFSDCGISLMIYMQINVSTLIDHISI